MLPRLLDDVRVLDLGQVYNGPYCGLLLAAQGAEVIKIEPPAGEIVRRAAISPGGASYSFLMLNAGKKGLAIDLKQPSGHAAMLRLAAQADVVVESFRPGVMDKLGLGHAQLAAVNPKIILCSISGFGQTGPYVHRAGHDIGYLAVAGVLAMGGEHGGAPMMPGVQIADLAGGALWGATAILGALVRRHRTGTGAFLDISMTEGALALLSAELGNVDCGAHPTRGMANTMTSI